MKELKSVCLFQSHDPFVEIRGHDDTKTLSQCLIRSGVTIIFKGYNDGQYPSVYVDQRRYVLDRRYISISHIPVPIDLNRRKV